MRQAAAGCPGYGTWVRLFLSERDCGGGHADDHQRLAGGQLGSKAAVLATGWVQSCRSPGRPDDSLGPMLLSWAAGPLMGAGAGARARVAATPGQPRQAVMASADGRKPRALGRARPDLAR